MSKRSLLLMILVVCLTGLDVSTTIAEEWIVYSSNEGGYDDFWRMHPDGSEKTAITNDDITVHGWLTGSPDGKQVSYVDNSGDLCTLYVDGSEAPEVLLSGEAYSGGTWAPGGRYIYYSYYNGTGNNDAYRYDLVTGTNEFLYDGPEIWPGKNNSGVPAVRSPNESLYAIYAQDGSWAPTYEVFIFDPDLQNVIRVTNDGNNDRRPIWSPDGTSLTWLKINDIAETGPDFRSIHLCNPDGSGVTEIFHHDGSVEVRLGGWSPDGQWIIFASDFGGNWDLYRLNPNGFNDYENITNTPDIDEKQSVWVDEIQPEEWIVFSSNEGGNEDFWRMHPDGSEKTSITSGDITVHGWLTASPDGTQVSYVNAAGDLCRLDIDGNENPEVLLSGLGYSGATWSPNGRYIYYSYYNGTGNNDAYRYDLATGTNQFLYDGPEIWPGKNNTGVPGVRAPYGSMYAIYAQDGSWAPSYELFIVDPELDNVVRVTDDGNNDRRPIWSPDGASLVWLKINDIAETGPDFRSIHRCNPDGSGATEIFHHDGSVEVRLGGWSPDGQWIIFASDFGGNWDLYRLNPSGFNEYENITNTPDIDETQSTWAKRSSINIGLNFSPSSGTLPFDSTVWVSLSHNHEDLTRRLAAHIDIITADGGQFSNWRAGFTNISGGESFATSWTQTIPMLGRLAGDNVFSLITEDVTPAPFNQPPYPLAGDTMTCSIMLRAEMP